ncbi:MAG: hypothetical protein KAX18_12250 [Candidatus Lokiarchaeota archaeon]|nr:hypothetical protein [Candidatus Lokiarchaeota archaeon]
MAAPKLKSKDLVICNKCGNVMITRKIRMNHSSEEELQTINQCIVCRFWLPLNK